MLNIFRSHPDDASLAPDFDPTSSEIDRAVDQFGPDETRGANDSSQATSEKSSVSAPSASATQSGTRSIIPTADESPVTVPSGQIPPPKMSDESASVSPSEEAPVSAPPSSANKIASRMADSMKEYPSAEGWDDPRQPPYTASVVNPPYEDMPDRPVEKPEVGHAIGEERSDKAA